MCCRHVPHASNSIHQYSANGYSITEKCSIYIEQELLLPLVWICIQVMYHHSSIGKLSEMWFFIHRILSTVFNHQLKSQVLPYSALQINSCEKHLGFIGILKLQIDFSIMRIVNSLIGLLLPDNQYHWKQNCKYYWGLSTFNYKYTKHWKHLFFK